MARMAWSAAISTMPTSSVGGFRYVNTGDWVESCTAIVEHHNGRLEILSWTHLIGEQAACAGRGGRGKRQGGGFDEAAE